MLSDAFLEEALASFVDDGWIDEPLFEVKSGKEATVFCCSGSGALAEVTDEPIVAVKIYREFTNRSFKNDSVYQAGRIQFAQANRTARALKKRSRYGRKAQHVLWLAHEWEMMKLLHKKGIDIPKPYALNEYAIIMQFVGTKEGGAAPPLLEVELSPERAAEVVDQLLHDVVAMVDLHVVHGDLSPYNILWWEDQPWIIDFPQAVDPRLNPAAQGILARDIENICRWGERFGVERDPQAFMADLWTRFTEGQIG